METAYSTPSWLLGLLVVFSLAAAATFGLFLWRHAELSGLREEASSIEAKSAVLESEVTAIERIPPALDSLISDRRSKIADLADNERTNIADVDRLVTQNAATLKSNEEAQAKELATYLALMKEAPERRHELEKEEEREYASEREHDEQRRQMRDDVEKVSVTIEQMKKKGRQENTTLDARIDELESRVRQLTQEQDLASREFKSDGQIVASQSADGFVVINRGHRQNLRNGTKFTVFNKRGGRTIQKGEIQIIAVEEGISTARVLIESDKNDPLISGDHLHNPIYDPDKVKRFAIRGDFTSYSKEEIAEFIKDSGGAVDPEITIRTDYLVAGGKADKALDQATKLGVSILSEDQLLSFVRLRPKFSSVAEWQYIKKACAEHRTFALAGNFTQADAGLIKQYISSHGGKTTGGVSAGIEAVVVGEGAEKEMSEARKLGVTIIDQSQFSHLTKENVKE
jgi:NAD-dependent DNA ligase